MNNDSTITIKLSTEDKKAIGDIAKELNMTTSEYMRINALSSFSKTISVKKENEELKNQLDNMRVKLSYYSEIEACPNAIVLPTNKEQRALIKRIYGRFYGDEIGSDKALENHILNFLIDDATYPHYSISVNFNLEQSYKVVDMYGQTHTNPISKLPTWAKQVGVSLKEIQEVFEDIKLTEPTE